ncbi:RHS repeat-associated core domain-containing protein [Dactylosporangium sp. NPDC051485]|uniref:RHS repeat-associated core domain-containing protein n=1 Tax=Dactylosporangium sp. NPDC051485 TaxID=3154846 RepID=UPI0034345D8A
MPLVVLVHSRPAPIRPPAQQQWSSVHGSAAAPVTVHQADPGPRWQPAPVHWPAAATATVDLSRALEAQDPKHASTAVRAGTMPVTVAAEPGSPSRVQIALADRDAARDAGVDGLLLQAKAPDAQAGEGPVRVWVDPSGIAGLYGGDWAQRLRLVSLPACAATSPKDSSCQAQTPLATSRDKASGALSATLGVGAGAATMFALAAAPAGTTGDYTATALKPSGTWTAGGSNGDFGYTYPIDVPPVAGDLTPGVALSYSSQSVDGEQVATNNQSSGFGDGWSYAPGSVERSYRSCTDDPAGTAPKVPDMCWSGPIVRVAFGAGSGELVYDASLPTKWKMANDNGAKVELLSGADNGAHGGEYWKITTQDGVQYFFGLNKLPGYAAGNPATNSTYTERVYSAHSGEPCFSSAGFASSGCDMGWKWDLDYVVDPRHNAVAYYYQQEINYYGANKGTTGVKYVRGGYLDHADYGLRDPSPYASPAPARVRFTQAERCTESATACAPGNIASAPTKWPDTPYDLNCNAGATCNNHAPTFWTRLRTNAITTQIYDGVGYTDVDSYALTQSFPDPGDGTTPAMWLSSIQHTAGTGAAAITLPAVSFDLTKLPNRADGIDAAPAMNHPRISAITTETGETIGVGYRTECTAPVSQDVTTNTSLCYPVYWTRDGYKDPQLDWFHKYVVTQVTDQDPTGKSPPSLTSYEYLGGAAWHYDDGELVKDKNRTYGQWRGFGRVLTRKGGGTDPVTLGEEIYFRGMDGDKLPNNGRRSATVSLSAAVPVPGAAASVPDTNELAGSIRQSLTYTADGGTVDHSTVTDYWVSPARATRTRPASVGDLTAKMSRAVSVKNTAAITSSATPAWRTTRTDTTYDTGTGLETVEYDYGDVTDPGQASCAVTTYAPTNNAAYLVSFVAQKEEFALPCGGSGVNGLTAPASVSRPADVVSSVRTFYDTDDFNTTWPAPAPSVGNVSVNQVGTETDGVFAYVTTKKSLYDGYGRITKSYDARGYSSTSTYTMTNGHTSQTAVVDAAGHTATTTLEPTHGDEIAQTDTNQQTTTKTYDALGRLTGVWLPGRALNQGANIKFAYTVSQTVPSTASTSTINDDGSYRTEVELFDALARSRQKQSPSPSGGRLVTDTFYDSHGWTVKSNNSYYDASSAPSTTMLDMVGHDNQIPNQDVFTYDGMGRRTLAVSQSKGAVKWQTQTIYGGDRTTTIPPQGGTPTTSIVDALGRRVQLLSYTSQPSVSGSVVSGGSPVHIGYHYDRRGNADTTTDERGSVWTSTFDLQGRVISKADPDTGTSTMKYDATGNLTASTDQLGHTLSFTYDALGRRTGEYDGTGTGSPRSTWSYDSTTISNGIGQLSSATRYDGGWAYVTTISGYDAWGKQLGQTVTIPAAPGNGGLAGTYTFSSEYSQTAGLLLKTNYPLAGGLPKETVNTTYTALDSMSGVGSSFGDYIDSTVYSPYGQVSQTKLGFGTTNTAWTTNIYDEHSGRLLNTYVDRSGTGTSRINDVTYTYNAAGKVLKAVDARNSATSSETQCFRYDLLGRLTTAWTANDNCASDLSTGGSNATVGGISPYWSSWTYNSVGDRTAEVQHALAGQSADTRTTYVYPTGTSQPHTLQSATTTGPAGTSTRSFQYDVLGNSTTRTTPQLGNQTFSWDPEGKLSAVRTGSTVNASYVYDANGNVLLQRDVSAKTATLFLPGEELTLNTDTTAVSGKRYYTGPDGTQAVRTGTTAAQYTYLVNDKVGTATMSLDHNGQNPQWRLFTPFGAPRGTAPAQWPDAHGFLGKQTDASTGLTILSARHYDPVDGRFVSADPVLDTADPNQLGGYTYAGDDPINRADPNGTDAYDEQTPCAHFDCGPGNYDRSDEATPNATNKPENGWQAPPKPPKEPKSTTEKPKKKTKCGTFDMICRTKQAYDASLAFAQRHSEAVGLIAGIVVGVGCAALTGGGGAVLCGALGGFVESAVSGALEMSKGEGYGWGSFARDLVVGTALGALAGAAGPVARGMVGGIAKAEIRNAIAGPLAKGAAKGGRAAFGELWQGTKDAVKLKEATNIGQFVRGSAYGFKADYTKAVMGAAEGSAGKAVWSVTKSVARNVGVGMGSKDMAYALVTGAVIPGGISEIKEGYEHGWAFPQRLLFPAVTGVFE